MIPDTLSKTLPIETLDRFHFVLCRKLSLTEPKSIRPFAILNCIDTPRLLEWASSPSPLPSNQSLGPTPCGCFAPTFQLIRLIIGFAFADWENEAAIEAVVVPVPVPVKENTSEYLSKSNRTTPAPYMDRSRFVINQLIH